MAWRGKNHQKKARRRGEKKPGKAGVDGLVFVVDQGVLIPRVETAQIVAVAEKLAADKVEVDFAEIGTGCGAIGISLFRRLENKNKRVRAILADVSSQALEMTKKNLDRLIPESDGAEIVASDLMEQIA